MNTDRKDFTNHQGLKEVLRWSMNIHGKPGNSVRGDWCLAAAVAIVNGLPMPEPLMEGNTKKVWRSTPNRLETIKRILASAEGVAA